MGSGISRQEGPTRKRSCSQWEPHSYNLDYHLSNDPTLESAGVWKIKRRKFCTGYQPFSRTQVVGDLTSRCTISTISFLQSAREHHLGVRLPHGGRGSNGITADRTTAARRADLDHESHSLSIKAEVVSFHFPGKTLEMTRKWEKI